MMRWPHIVRTGCLISLSAVIIVVGGLVIAGQFYTAERKWVEGSEVGQLTATHPPLKIALGGCVSQHDPQAMKDFQQNGSYRTSGWFLPEDRWSAVARCMQLKGWLLLPVRIYTP